MSYARVEYCGQKQKSRARGTIGAYCMHFHHLGHCSECFFEGNAVEHLVEAGLNVHDTHDARVHRSDNVLEVQQLLTLELVRQRL